MSETPPSRWPEEFPADRVVGTILLILDAVGTCAGLFLVGAALSGPASGNGDRTGMIGLVFLLLILIVAVTAFVHYGIYCGRRWAFVASLLLSALGLCGSANGSGALGVVIAFSTLVYSALRLGGALGPRPA